MRSSRLFWKLALANVTLNVVVACLLVVVMGRHEGVRFTFRAGTSAVLWGGIGFMSALLAWRVSMRSWRDVMRVADAADRSDGDRDSQTWPIDRRSDAAPLMLAFQRMQRRHLFRLERRDEENHRLSTVLDGMDEGVLAMDAQRRVLLANLASRRLLQIPTDNIVDRPLVEVIRSREVHQAVEATLRGDAVYETEFDIGGEPRRHLRLRAKRLPGRPSPGVVLVVSDVSHLRRLENLRTEFAANVSHELKTPLASIKAYAETLRLGAVNDAENNLVFVARIEEHADRLYFLISDLLHLARVESGKEVFEIANFPLADLVEESVDYHRDAAEAKNISLHTEHPEVDLEVRSDEVGVRTILDNLVNNAIKYTREGGRVTVGWRGDGALVLIEVCDTGIGIAPEDQNRVFERFYRVDKARSRDVGGTGLGLSIVKHTAQALGGCVELESQLGAGSTFRVWLPQANPLDAS